MFECLLEMYLLSVSNGCPADSWDSPNSDHFQDILDTSRYFALLFRYFARIVSGFFGIRWILGAFSAVFSQESYFVPFLVGKINMN